MAVLRALSQRSCAVSVLCPNFGHRLGRQLSKRCICARRHGSVEFLTSAYHLSAGNANLKLRQSSRYLGHDGRRTFNMKYAFSARTTPEWSADQSPYETLEIERDAGEDEIKASYRRMAKQYHPDVYHDTPGALEEGETPESKFIRIQAAYELLMDKDQRRRYDMDHRVNPMQASKAWMEWILKKKKAFEQRGDMAASVWAEQQQREMSLKARRLARHKMDPEEERRLLAKEKMAAIKNFETTLTRHTLVLKKRDIMRKRAAEDAKKKLVQQLLAAEGLELEEDQ